MRFFAGRKGTGNSGSNSRFPSGITTRKATTKAKATARGWDEVEAEKADFSAQLLTMRL
jgi:hypothetical protein